MKKLLKSVMGLASVAAIAAGAYYFTKKWMDEKDEELEDEFDDLDFDDEEEDSREYVTLDMEKEAGVAEEDIAENGSPEPDAEEVVQMAGANPPAHDEE